MQTVLKISEFLIFKYSTLLSQLVYLYTDTKYQGVTVGSFFNRFMGFFINCFTLTSFSCELDKILMPIGFQSQKLTF